MRIEDYETNHRATRGELDAAGMEAWRARLAKDESLAREVASDAAIGRAMDRIGPIEPSKHALNRILEGADGAPVISMEGAATAGQGRSWWRRHWAIEAGLVAAAMVVIAVLFVLPTGTDKPGTPEAKLVDTADWVIEPYDVDPSVWMELEDDGDGEAMNSGQAVNPDAALMGMLLSLEMTRAKSMEVPRAKELSGIESQDDWLKLLEGLDF